MIVVAIIAVIAAIAIPLLSESTLTTNETAAAKLLFTYAESQLMYYTNDYDGDSLSNYAASFLDLQGLVDKGGNIIDLLPAEFYAATGVATPHKGYYFNNITDWQANRTGFGLCANPAHYGSSGRKTFIINHRIIVYWQDQGAISEINAWPSAVDMANWKGR